MNEVDIAWLAGLLEGEGYFQNQKSGYPRIRLVMTDEDVVQRVADLLERKVTPWIRKPFNPLHKIQYYLDVSGMDAVDLMKLIRPYMGKRRGQKIDEILAGWHGSRAGKQDKPHIRGVKHFNHKLTETDVLQIREYLKQGKTQVSLGKLFGVSNVTIRHIAQGKVWAWLR